jgi:hypothetical protein
MPLGFAPAVPGSDRQLRRQAKAFLSATGHDVADVWGVEMVGPALYWVLFSTEQGKAYTLIVEGVHPDEWQMVKRLVGWPVAAP